MSNLPLPFSRDSMRFFKIAKDETIKNMKIDYIVNKIYGEAVRFAETNSDTLYKFSLGPPNSFSIGYITVPSNVVSQIMPVLTSPILIENVIDYLEVILRRLQTLFPDCIVEHRKEPLPKERFNEYIVIDWS